MKSTDYYEQHAEEFIAKTRDADMTEHYEHFLQYVPNGGSILDAGSGSGRDAAWFKARGYSVEAFDASPAMVRATRQFSNVPTRLMAFEEFEWDHEFDGIWACASLLHVQRDNLVKVLGRLLSALRPDGCIYCSFKLGSEEREVNGRYFNDMDPMSFQNALDYSGAYVKAKWQTDDVRLDRHGEKWLNAVISRQP